MPPERYYRSHQRYYRLVLSKQQEPAVVEKGRAVVPPGAVLPLETAALLPLERQNSPEENHKRYSRGSGTEVVPPERYYRYSRAVLPLERKEQQKLANSAKHKRNYRRAGRYYRTQRYYRGQLPPYCRRSENNTRNKI